MTSERTPGIGALAFFAFLLFGIPRLNLKIGPIPLYMVDIMAVLLIFYFGSKIRGHKYPKVRYPFGGMIVIITVLVAVSEVASMLYGADFFNSLYLAVRFTLAFAIVFAIPKMVRSLADVEVILKAITLGLLLTSLTMVLTSLPGTRHLVANTLFKVSYLEPAAKVSDRYLTGSKSGDSGVRGRTLIGVSILSASVASIAWPLVGCLRAGAFRLSLIWQGLAASAVLLTPMAVAMSYSRQAAVGAGLVALAVLVMPVGKLRRSILRPVFLSIGVVAAVGVGSSLFFFERYANRFSAIFDDPLNDVREADRLLSYIEPFEHVAHNPLFFLIGEGTAVHRTGVAEQIGAANHSLMGAGYFSHGMVSTLLFFVLVFTAFFFANRHRTRLRHVWSRNWANALFLAYLPIFPIVAFSPGLGNHPKVVYVFSFVLALLCSLKNLTHQQSVQRRMPLEMSPQMGRFPGSKPIQTV